MSGQAWIAAISSLFLFLLLCAKEVTRPERANLIWRLIASLAASAFLAFLVIPVFYHQQQPEKNLVLLTEGFEFGRTDLAGRNVDRVTFDPSLYAKFREKYSCRLISGDDIKLNRTEIKIIGFGLDSRELKGLGNGPVVFNPPAIPSGFRRVDWTRNVVAGSPFRMQGIFENKRSTPLKLFLKVFGNRLDSAVIMPSSVREVNLTSIPRQFGSTVFQMIGLSGNDTIINELLPFEVVALKKPNVLMLSNAPGFEARFLKNWLGDHGYSVIARTRITTGKLEKEFINTPTVSTEKITQAILDSVDVIISDAAELQQITAAELSQVRQQIANKGMGLIVRADSSTRGKSFYNRDHVGIRYPGNDTLLLWGNAARQDSGSLSRGSDSYANELRNAFPALQNTAIALTPESEAAVIDRDGNCFVDTRLLGQGRTAYCLLGNTYLLQLSGNVGAYASLWSFIIDRISKRQTVLSSITTRPQFPLINEPVVIELQSSRKKNPGMALGGIRLAPEQDFFEDDKWRAVTWPQSPGWLRVNLDDSTTRWIYNYPENAWAIPRAFEKMTLTSRFVAHHNAEKNQTKSAAGAARRELPRFPFFLLFLASAVFLWAENKSARLAGQHPKIG